MGDQTALEANAAKSKIEELMAKLADLQVEFTKVESIKSNIVDESFAGPSNNIHISNKENEKNEKSKRKRERNRTKPKKEKLSECSTKNVGDSNDELNSLDHVAPIKCKKKEKPAKNYAEVITEQPKISTHGYDDRSLIVNLTPETVLIYKLLIMQPAERDKFIYKQAKERRILIRNMQTGVFEFNPVFYGNTSAHHPLIESRDSSINNKENRWFAERRIRRKKLKSREEKVKSKHNKTYDLFEKQVNRLLYGEEQLTEQEKEAIVFLYNENENEKEKLFSTDENQRNLEQFIGKLIEKDLGYIVESEIRINQKNNHEGYVTNNVNDEGDILVPSIVLRQCALHGDSVKVFAVKPNVYNTKRKAGNEVQDVKVISIDKDEGGTDNDDEEDKDLAPAEVIDTPTPIKHRVLGFVLKILEKVNTRQCIGTFQKISKTAASIFKPRDSKLPHIKINPIHMPESLLNLDQSNDETDSKENKIEDILYYAEIIDSSHHELIGRIIRPVGKCGELEIENQAILLQNGLNPIKFTDDILNEIPSIPFIIPDSEYLLRTDLRDHCIFTIDPPTARDLDDAVSSKILLNGNYEIGVHISDVSYFIKENSEIDEKIKTQTTSIYLVDKVYHMLPEKLCFLCSLTPGEDKLAFSVIWEITKNGEIVKTEFKRSVINSSSQISYDHAQAVIENPDKVFDESNFPQIYNNHKPNDLIEIIKQLNTIALILRQQRFDNGALRINQPKLKFILDHITGKPISYYTERQQSSNYLIEDFMLLANQSVAAFIFEKFPDLAVLRKHDPPNETALMKVKTKLSALNLNFDISSSKSIRESLEQLPKLCKFEDAATSILNFITAKQMTRAKYICSDQVTSIDELNHYALSIPIYTHFTSPIRRYPDILVHRLLCAGLDMDKTPQRTSNELNKILKNSNQQKMDSKSAGDDSANLYFIHYLKSVGTLKLRAAILDIMEYSMEVIVMETGHILRIPYKSRTNKGQQLKLKYYLENDKPTVLITSEESNNAKPFKLEVLSECTIELSIKNEKLHGVVILNNENE